MPLFFFFYNSEGRAFSIRQIKTLIILLNNQAHRGLESKVKYFALNPGFNIKSKLNKTDVKMKLNC